MEAKDYFNKICWFVGSSWHQLPSSSDKNFLFFLVPAGHLSHRKCMPCFFRAGEGQRALPVSAVFQLPSAQNNQYAKVASLGMHVLIPSLRRLGGVGIHFKKVAWGDAWVA